MLTKAINDIPQQGKLQVIQSAIFNLNMRLVALGRQQLAATNRENSLFAVPESEDTEFFTREAGGGTFQFGGHLDGANTLDERDRASTDSAAVRDEQGHETPVEPTKQAEPFITMRDMLYLKYLDECNKARRRPLDQSFESIINWMYDRPFQPNGNEAQAVYTASKGRVSVEQAIKAQKLRFDQERDRLKKIAEPLLKTMEDFAGLDLGEFLQTDTPTHVDGDVVLDKLFDNLPALVRLGIVNVMWRRCHRLVTEDFPARKVPTNDFASDIALAIASEDEFLDVARKLYDDCHDEYKARVSAGLPPYAVVDEIERLKKEKAKADAAQRGALAKPSARAA